VFLAILKVIGIVLLVLLAVVLILLLLPVGVMVDWSDDALTVKARILCFSIPLYPGRPGKKQQKPAKTPPPAEPSEPAQNKWLTRLKGAFRDQPLEKLRHLLDHAGRGARLLLRGLHFRHICIVWPVTEEEASQTAITYGVVLAAANTLWMAADDCLKLQADELRIFPDFTGEQAKKRKIACQITAQLYIILATGVLLLYQVWKDPVLHP
jgi:hypothetical protein